MPGTVKREMLKQLRDEYRNSRDCISMAEYLYWRDELQRLGLWDGILEEAAATRERERVDP